uniref:Uncharacterized protein n=1 Tax=Ananas comosus var. bracteatus TaxID=296719 RepID=A0A6V7QRQ1_ANACO
MGGAGSAWAPHPSSVRDPEGQMTWRYLLGGGSGPRKRPPREHIFKLLKNLYSKTWPPSSPPMNKSIKDFVELIADECKYICASLPAFHLSQLGKKVFEFLLLMMMRSDLMFVIKPSADHGVDVGVRMVAAWSEDNLPIGFGLNVYTSHVYDGVVFIKKANTVLEPLLRLKELPSKLEEILLALIGKMVPEDMLEGKRKVIFMYCFLGLLVMAISYVLLKGA